MKEGLTFGYCWFCRSYCQDSKVNISLIPLRRVAPQTSFRLCCGCNWQDVNTTVKLVSNVVIDDQGWIKDIFIYWILVTFQAWYVQPVSRCGLWHCCRAQPASRSPYIRYRWRCGSDWHAVNTRVKLVCDETKDRVLCFLGSLAWTDISKNASISHNETRSQDK